MKRILSLFLACTLVLCSMGSCNSSDSNQNEGSVNSETASSQINDMPIEKIEEVDVKSTLSAESSTILDVTSSNNFNALAGDRTPSNAILHLNDDLFIIADDGLYVPFEAALAMCEENVVPVLYVTNKNIATSLGKKLAEQEITDCIVMSDDAELVKITRELAPKVSGAIDARDNELDEDLSYLIQVRDEANRNNAKIVLFGSDAERDDVLYLQRRLMTVWVEADDDTVESHCNALITGANGIVTSYTDSLFNAIDKFEKDTLFREVNIVGHRGQPITNVDNTLSGARAAIDAGADAIECDIHLTGDMEFVIMHDNDISYYTEGVGKSETLRTDQVQFFVIKGTKGEHIPTLKQFFDSFRNDDIIHTIEIKTTNPDAIYLLRDLITQCGVSHQVNLISFYMDQLKLAREVMPEISCGYLGTIDGVYSNIARAVNTYNLSYHPVHYKMSPGNAYELNNRGVSVNPWTYSDEKTMCDAMMYGYTSLTTDGSLWASDFVTEIIPNKNYKMTVGETFQFKATAKTKTGGKEIICEPIVVGGDNITFTKSGEGFTASAAGETKVLLKYSELLKNGKIIYHYSQSVNVTIK